MTKLSEPDIKRDASEQPVSKLPGGYPAYCVYVPTGMNPVKEKIVLDRLVGWGKATGKNLYVAPWDIGDPSYANFLRAIGFSKKPSIILTDTPAPDAKSFRIVIDNPRLTRDVDSLTELLPALLDLILIGENKTAIKEKFKASRMADIKSLVISVSGILSRFTFNISWDGINIKL